MWGIEEDDRRPVDGYRGTVTERKPQENRRQTESKAITFESEDKEKQFKELMHKSDTKSKYVPETSLVSTVVNLFFFHLLSVDALYFRQSNPVGCLQELLLP